MRSVHRVSFPDRCSSCSSISPANASTSLSRALRSCLLAILAKIRSVVGSPSNDSDDDVSRAEDREEVEWAEGDESWISMISRWAGGMWTGEGGFLTWVSRGRLAPGFRDAVLADGVPLTG